MSIAGFIDPFLLSVVADMTGALDEEIEAKAKERVDAKQKEIDKLTIELNSARIERDHFREDSLKVTRISRLYKEWLWQAHERLYELQSENIRLSRSWWRKVKDVLGLV